MNGMNLIDGMNGLFGLTAVFQLLTLAVMSYSLEDNHVFNLSITFIIPLIVFLIFNIPCAKLFIGDSGAYLFGFLISFY